MYPRDVEIRNSLKYCRKMYFKTQIRLSWAFTDATRTFAQNLKNVVWVHGARPFPGMAESMADKVILKLAEEMANA